MTKQIQKPDLHIFTSVKDVAVGFDVHDLDSGTVQLSDDADGPVFLKELIYDGKFVKDAGKPSELAFSVNQKLRDHWVSTFDEMRRDGVKVPMPLEHTHDPDKNKAWLLGLRNGVDSKGRNALFGVVKYPDHETAKLRHTTDVSIFSPPSAQNGKGKIYERPIRHVAHTCYPVIPDLDGFKTIAASFVGAEHTSEKTEMSKLKALAQKLKLSVESDDADTIADAIVAAFDKNPAPATIALSQLPSGISEKLINLTKQTRENAINQLHRDRRINRATCDELKTLYCSEAAIELSLSDDGDDDVFSATITALSKNSQQTTEYTREQVLALSDGRAGGGTNALLADVDRRVKASQNGK